MTERKVTTGADAMPQDGKPTRKEDPEMQKLIKEIRTILNNLTSNSFTMLMQRVLSLKIDTEKKLRTVIDLIFNKAINEPTYSEAYANMCRQMTSIKVAPDEIDQAVQDPVPPVEFRKLLLTKCQQKFDENRHDDTELLELKKSIDQAQNADLALQLTKEYESRLTVKQNQHLGNIRFIGELFKLRMLTESIMHNCIMSLFKARAKENYLERLCLLLTTIGKDLDQPKAKQRMDQYFEQIKKMIASDETSPRMKSMLGKVRDLRLNNWVPKKADNDTSNYKIQSKSIPCQRRKKRVIKVVGTNINQGVNDDKNGEGHAAPLAHHPGRSVIASVAVASASATQCTSAAGSTETNSKAKSMDQEREKQVTGIIDSDRNQDITDDIIKSQRSDLPSTTQPADIASKFTALLQVSSAESTKEETPDEMPPTTPEKSVSDSSNSKLKEGQAADQ